MGLLYKSRPKSFTFQHWAGVRLYTTFFNLAESCVFSKQSPLSLCLTTLIVALLIPKIRSHLAEFLRRRSLVSLSILYKPTCVSFGTVKIFITSDVTSNEVICIRARYHLPIFKVEAVETRGRATAVTYSAIPTTKNIVVPIVNSSGCTKGNKGRCCTAFGLMAQTKAKAK